MAMFSKQVKKELVNALSNKRSAMFVLDGKLVSIEMEEGVSDHEGTKDLAQEIEEYPELKESLNRYMNNPGMKRFTAEELKEMRNARKG